MRIKLNALIFGLLLIQMACSDLTQTEEDSDLLSIDEGITFSVVETHDQANAINTPVEPHVELQMKTNDIYPCINYRIVSDISQTSTEKNVTIDGVKDPGVCLTALGPAQNEFKLNIEPGKYDLTFFYKMQLFDYQLTVEESSIKVTGDGGSFVSSETETFWRYPENSFTFLCRSTQDTRWMCEDFEHMLNDSLRVTSFEFPDEGTVPYPTESEQYDIANYYSYPEESVFQKAGEMLEAYSDSVVIQQEGAYLSVISWKNQGFRSWTDTGE